MSDISTSGLDDWKRIRQQGIFRYILTRGVLTAGLVFAFATVILEVFVFERELRLVGLAVRTLMFSTFFGSIAWSINERKYKKRIRVVSER
jgi:hypothetical protein